MWVKNPENINHLIDIKKTHTIILDIAKSKQKSFFSFSQKKGLLLGLGWRETVKKKISLPFHMIQSEQHNFKPSVYIFKHLTYDWKLDNQEKQSKE